MKNQRIGNIALLAIGLAGVLLSLRGQTGSATATVGMSEVQFVFPTWGDPVQPPPLPPPPEPPRPLPRVVPPSSPQDFRIESSTDRELVLTWTPAQAAPGHAVVNYEILRNGSIVAKSASPHASQSYQSAGRVVEFFSVRAVDEQGARSARSNEVMAPRTTGLGELLFQAKTAFGRREVVGYPGLNGGEVRFRRRDYSYRLHRVDPASGSVLDKTESIAQILDPESGLVRNESRLSWTGTGIYANSNLSIDYEGYENDPDFSGVPLDAVRLAVFSNDPDKTDTHAKVEVTGPSDFQEVSEIIYSGVIDATDLEAGLQADFSQAQSQLDFLDWGQTQGVSRGEWVEGQGLPLAERGLTQLVASDYRLGVPAGGKWHVRWAEIFIPDDGEVNQVLAIYDEEVDATNGVAFTSPHHVVPSDRAGVTTIALLNEFAEALPAGLAASRTFVPNAIFSGQFVHVQVAATSFSLGGSLEPPNGSGGPGPLGPPIGGETFSLPPPYHFSSIVLSKDDPTHAVRLFAIDPAVEIAAGLAEAMARGREIVSGTNLVEVQLPNGLGYGEWQLIALGQGAGSVELSLEYENLPLTRVTLHLDVYPTIEMAVDANRDHVVTPSSAGESDATTDDAPFRFWLNDDIDRNHTVDETDHEEDDIGPAEAAAEHWTEDWKYNAICSERDLEDFARLSIVTNGWEHRLKNGDILLGLKWAEVSGNPAIKLYHQSDPGGGISYLTDSTQARSQLLSPALLDDRGSGDDLSSASARTIIGSGDIFVLPASVWTRGESRTSFLFEGCRAGKGCLQPVLLQREGADYVEIGEIPGVWFDLKTIGEMYEHWSVGNGDGAAPAPAAARVTAEKAGGQPFGYAADDPTEREYILFVHGWNMEKWEKERFAETAYKRLYWQGYRGRFGLFSWPTTYGFASNWDAIFDSTNFDRGEFAAWRSAEPLRQLLQDLAATYGGEIYVFSHSMGAVVASEALRLQSDARGPQIAKVYVAGQAALSAHVYDGALSDAEGAPDALQWHYTHPRLHVPGAYGPDTPDVYRNWAAFITTGSSVSSAVVGRVVNFYNENDYALSAPVWQFNQLTKPDFADFPDWLWQYRYAGDPAAAPTNTGFRKVGEVPSFAGEQILRLGTRLDPADRYEIMAFAAESRVKALGATADLQHGISGAVNLRSLWPNDNEEHKAHRWHSAEFRSTIQSQRNCWRAVLDKVGFDISAVFLP